MTVLPLPLDAADRERGGSESTEKPATTLAKIGKRENNEKKKGTNSEGKERHI